MSCGEEADDEADADNDEAIDVDEMPGAGDADRVPIAGYGEDWGDVARIIFGGPDAVGGHTKRGEANPFAARCTVVVEIEARMIHEDGEAAAGKHGQKEKIEEMEPANPAGETVRSSHGAFAQLRDCGHRGQAVEKILSPGKDQWDEHGQNKDDERGRANPNAEAAVRRVMDSTMGSVKRDHERQAEVSEGVRELSFRLGKTV